MTNRARPSVSKPATLAFRALRALGRLSLRTPAATPERPGASSSPPVTSGLPAYVERDGAVVFRVPYIQRDARLFGWVVPASRARLQVLLDETFAALAPAGCSYRALADAVVITFADIESVSSWELPDAARGHTREGDVVVWIPTGRYDGERLVRVLWHMAYIWVDNPIAMTIGREVHGFPKALGRMALPSPSGSTTALWVESLAIERYDAGTPMTWRRLIEIERVAPDTARSVRTLVDGLRAFSMPGLSREALAALVADFSGGHLPIVFLKQFRDVLEADRACYQAIIEADATVQS